MVAIHALHCPPPRDCWAACALTSSDLATMGRLGRDAGPRSAAMLPPSPLPVAMRRHGPPAPPTLRGAAVQAFRTACQQQHTPCS